MRLPRRTVRRVKYEPRRAKLISGRQRAEKRAIAACAPAGETVKSGDRRSNRDRGRGRGTTMPKGVRGEWEGDEGGGERGGTSNVVPGMKIGT